MTVWDFPFFPEAASTSASRVDALMLFDLAVAVGFASLVAGLILFFSFKYHHRSSADRSNPVFSSVPLEIAWTLIPLIIALSMFVGGAILFIQANKPPADAIEMDVVGKQWMWTMQHPEGRREINELHIPVGRPIKLLMTSQDVIHSFYVPAFRAKQDVLPGRYTVEWFEAREPGTYHLFCAQYCGTSHSAMIGQVIAMAPADYEKWLAGEPGTPTGGSLADQGEALFRQFGCATCHRAGPGGAGPSLAGLFGSSVPLADGRTVRANEDYLRESILKPQAKIVRGYQPLMPTFQGQLNEEQLQQLIAYIKSLKES